MYKHTGRKYNENDKETGKFGFDDCNIVLTDFKRLRFKGYGQN